MSRDKKSKVDDITKLRKILDNPSDPETKKLVSEDEKALNSIQKRLAGEKTKTPQKSEIFLRKYDTLEPKITIRTKTPAPLPTTSLPTFQPVPSQPPKTQSPTTLPTFQLVPEPPVKTQPVTPLPEFELVSTPAPIKSTSVPEILFANEALYEVERIETNIQEFYEVTPIQTPEKPPETKTTMNPDVPTTREQNLPEWQPLEEPQSEEPQKILESNITVEFQQVDPDVESTSDKTTTSDIIPEFEPIDAPSTKTLEKPDDWTTLPLKKKPTETPMDFQPAEPFEPPLQTLTKKQERDAKKAEKQKDKEAKRQNKLELKKLKKEAKEKEQEARRLAQEQQPVQPKPEMTVEQPMQIPEEKPLQIKIDATAFKGIRSIDEKTAEILYKNGYFSIDNLHDATVEDLVQIRGIKRKLAKQIKKEVQQNITVPPEPEFVPIKGKTQMTPLKEASDDITEWESYHVNDSSEPSSPVDVCSYNGYTLYKQITSKLSGKNTTIHFFSKEKPLGSIPAQLPEGYQIVVNKKTGIPYLKKKK
jgi:hypothetical protein